MLTKSAYQVLRSRMVRYEAARKQFDPVRFQRGGGYDQSDCRAIVKLARTADVTNADRSRMEVYEFVNQPPSRYFAYVDVDKRVITTWTGDRLGDITGLGDPYRSNVGDTRIHVTVQAINGLRYYGTYFKSAGSYARLKVAVR